MVDLTITIAAIEAELITLTKQVSALAVGLQNIAPMQKTNVTQPSVQYLLNISGQLNECAMRCKKLLACDPIDQARALDALLAELSQADQRLREQYQVDNKFQFIRNNIQTVRDQIKTLIEAHTAPTDHPSHTADPNDNEVPVYVYLYNTNGIDLTTWKNMFTTSLLYDHSINRPIYQEQIQIEGFIKRKANQTQHGYLTVIVNRNDMLTSSVSKDAYGSPIIKVKEGSLSFNKPVLFTHNGHTYIVHPSGELTEKKMPSSHQHKASGTP